MDNPETTARQFGLAFRISAAQAVRSGRPLQDVARELNVDPEYLEEWTRSLDAERTVFAVNAPDLEELRRLRLENEYLRRQRDLYRKACGIVFTDASELESER